VRLEVLAGAAPTGVGVALVDPGESPADAEAADPSVPMSSAAAAAAAPAIRTRAQWGADESIRKGTPSYASSVKAVVVHHTASANGYSASQVPALLRGFYAYHVKSRGWSDLGYNVLVDRFGTAWEGRAGGVSRAVIGAHAGGFNTSTVGVSMIGTYDTVAPSAAMLATVSQLVAWRLSAAGVDPRGTVRLVSAGSTRYASGTAVTLPTVMGHRQVSTTACPGVLGFAALPGVRERAAALGAGAPATATGLQLVAPASAAAGTIAQLQVRGGAGGAPVEVFFSKRGEEGAQRRRPGDATGDGQAVAGADDGGAVRRGRAHGARPDHRAGRHAGAAHRHGTARRRRLAVAAGGRRAGLRAPQRGALRRRRPLRRQLRRRAGHGHLRPHRHRRLTAGADRARARRERPRRGGAGCRRVRPPRADRRPGDARPGRRRVVRPRLGPVVQPPS
jgi:hypothetical protein